MHLLILSLLAADPGIGGTSMSLDVASESLRAGDPLFIKAVVSNQGREEVRWRSAPHFHLHMGLEVRAEGVPDWHACGTQSSRLGLVGYPALALQPGESYSAHDALTGNVWLQIPGKYELRARLLHGPAVPGEDVATVYSTPRRVTVLPRSEKELALISAMKREIDWGVSARFSNSDTYAAELHKLEDALTPSILRTAAVWSRMVRQYRPELPCPEEKLRAIEDVGRTLDPVTAEVITLCLASRLHYHREWGATLRVLEAFEERNAIVESLRVECRSRLDPKQDN